MEVYREGFRVVYEGKVQRLTESIAEFAGVESVSGPSMAAQANGPVDIEVEYNTHETDRTRIALDAEDISGVESVTFI